jgi:uncharacterized membrane protein YkoI
MSASFRRASLAILLGGTACTAFAEFDASATFAPIDACIDAALQQQDGMLVRWEMKSPKDPTVDLEVVAPDNRVYTMSCKEGKVSTPERKAGQKKFEMLKSRAKVPEKSARFTAVTSYPIAEVRRMTYDLVGVRGRPYYSYDLVTNDGREASVDVNAETGMVDRSKSERKG